MTALTISEAAWQSRVIDTAIALGWHVYHPLPARTARGWATPTQGHPGFPDLTLARDGVVVLAELKKHNGRPTPQQRAWLDALGTHGRLWTPNQWPDVLTELQGNGRTGT